MPCFSWINTVLGNVKTALAGTYHAFKFRKYAIVTWPSINIGSTGASI
jgi:hypothetical protein